MHFSELVYDRIISAHLRIATQGYHLREIPTRKIVTVGHELGECARTFLAK